MIEVCYPICQTTPPLLSSGSDSEEDSLRSVASNIKLKNELCRNYLQTGYCKYHNKCQFAHGIQELRQHQGANNKYKTKRCLSYFDRACCSYGQRCNFQHQAPSALPETISRARRNFRELFWEVGPRRLPF